MKVQLQVSGSPVQAAASAADIAATGADGLFTFEGQHDVFFPLLIAAGTTGLDLMTNVAIAPPRSPLHMAHSAYDLQHGQVGRRRAVERDEGSHPVDRGRQVGLVAADGDHGLGDDLKLVERPPRAA